MSEEAEVHTFTEDELELTEDEKVRNMGRMAFDMIKMVQNGLPQDQAEVIAKLRNDPSLEYTVIPLDVDGVRTTCIALRIEGNAAIFALMSKSHKCVTMDGIDLFQVSEEMQKRTLN